MHTRDLAWLVTIGAIWGISFLFIRVAAPEFGAVALIEVRVVLAGLVLLPIALYRGELAEIKHHWRPIVWMGILHYAVPFTLFAWSMLTLTGGYTSIINACSPLFATIVAWLWLGKRPQRGEFIGMVVALIGVVLLVWNSLALGDGPTALAILAAFGGAACYGLAAVLARKSLSGVKPTAVSAGSMIAAATLLLPATFWLWPEPAPSAAAWSVAAALGVFCTALAFVLYFRLIANVGPTRAITVTFLVPVFAVVFGAILIGEAISFSMIVGGLVILFGTSIALGLVNLEGLANRREQGA
jgi:drug/metabolite transporter (DMT)-like permease